MPSAAPKTSRKPSSFTAIATKDVGFLVQLADGGGRDLAAPQRLGDVLHPAHGNAYQIHLNVGFLHAALPAAIPLDDGGFEGYALEPGYVERDVSGGRGKIPVIVTL